MSEILEEYKQLCRELNEFEKNKIPLEQNRCAMACQGCGAVLFLLK